MSQKLVVLMRGASLVPNWRSSLRANLSREGNLLKQFGEAESRGKPTEAIRVLLGDAFFRNREFRTSIVESTLAMQNLQPKIKAIQERYTGNQERIQLETSRLYKQAGVNPLAGCLPTLATIPVWIGLYQALSNVANEGLLTEGFLWIPSLGGPTSIAARQSGAGISWLFPFVIRATLRLEFRAATTSFFYRAAVRTAVLAQHEGRPFGAARL